MPLDPKKRSHWAEHHRRWQTSGLSQRQYCQRESLSLSSFDRWRRLIREAATVVSAARLAPAAQEKLALVPAQLDAVSCAGTPVILRSPAGWQVTLPGMLGQEMLAQLLSRLP